MKDNIETKYSVDDMIFIPELIGSEDNAVVNIRCRKIKRIIIEYSEGPPTIRYDLQGGDTIIEKNLYEKAEQALEVGIAQLVARRLTEDEEDGAFSRDDDADIDEHNDIVGTKVPVQSRKKQARRRQ